MSFLVSDRAKTVPDTGVVTNLDVLLPVPISQYGYLGIKGMGHEKEFVYFNKNGLSV